VVQGERLFMIVNLIRDEWTLDLHIGAYVL